MAPAVATNSPNKPIRLTAESMLGGTPNIKQNPSATIELYMVLLEVQRIDPA